MDAYRIIREACEMLGLVEDGAYIARLEAALTVRASQRAKLRQKLERDRIIQESPPQIGADRIAMLAGCSRRTVFNKRAEKVQKPRVA